MLQIMPLQPADLSACLRLSTEAGWNQLLADWQRLLEVFPGSCLVGRLDGEVVATANLSVFAAVDQPAPAVGWVGMVLVDAEHRKHGFGGAMMGAILDLAQQQGVPLIGLDATDLGRPVYLKKGFVDQMGIDRWTGPARLASMTLPGGVRPLNAEDWPALLALDRQATGVDRAALLRHLAGEAGARVRVCNRNGQHLGHAFARLGRAAEYLGPIVAADPVVARELAAALLGEERVPTRNTLLIDLPRGSALGQQLQPHGFSIARELTRMTRPGTPRPALCSDRVFGAAAFELG